MKALVLISMVVLGCGISADPFVANTDSDESTCGPSDTDTDTDTDTGTDIDTDADMDSESDTSSETTTETETITDTSTETNSEMDTETESHIDTDMDTASDTGDDMDSDTTTDTVVDTDTDTDTFIPDGWVAITGGTFWQGSLPGTGFDNEYPRHEVSVPSFWIRKTETTVSEYQACIDAGVCSEPDSWGIYPEELLCNWGDNGKDNHPLNCVSWTQAIEYCGWIGGRLPTESEWEYAAKSGGKDVAYPWGNEPAPSCAYAVLAEEYIPFDTAPYGCDTGRTWPICSKPLGNTEHGLCDMSGNVGEFVQDEYHKTYDVAPTDGSAWGDGVPGMGVVRRGDDFTIPYDGGYRVTTMRGNATMSEQSPNKGFRCAK